MHTSCLNSAEGGILDLFLNICSCFCTCLSTIYESFCFCSVYLIFVQIYVGVEWHYERKMMAVLAVEK